MSTEQAALNPRTGLAGVLDWFVGTGATTADRVLQVVFPFGTAAVAVTYVAYTIGTWSIAQYIFCSVLAFDIEGSFITLHLEHLALVSWVFLEFDFVWLIVAGLGIITTPLSLQRPVALLMCAGSIFWPCADSSPYRYGVVSAAILSEVICSTSFKRRENRSPKAY